LEKMQGGAGIASKGQVVYRVEDSVGAVVTKEHRRVHPKGAVCLTVASANMATQGVSFRFSKRPEIQICM
jgi:hypothetical protein